LTSSDGNIISNSKESDVGVGVLGKVLFFGETEVKNVSSVCWWEEEREKDEERCQLFKGSTTRRRDGTNIG